MADEIHPDHPDRTGIIKRVASQPVPPLKTGAGARFRQSIKGEDEVVMLIPARSLDTILFFSDRGKAYSEKAYQIPGCHTVPTRAFPIVERAFVGSR